MSSAAPSAPPPGTGCHRASLEGIEHDASCVLARATDDAMRDFAKRVTIDLVPDARVVPAGNSTLLRLTLKNTSSEETLLVFDALPRPPGPRPDYARLAGVPEAHPTNESTPRLHFGLTTTNSHDQNVDGMPTIPNSAPSPSPPRLLGVRLRPGAKLTHQVTWYALRIPPPPPVVTDDAGHRFIPKTLAVPLYPGEYTAALEVPFHGLVPAERVISTKLTVEPVPDPVPKKKPLPPTLPQLPPPESYSP
ncbi:MAG: hypothetical protein KF819_15970 [Labilithrix sp.]|nr:hypothetical protein [Labilithrix sp.]